MSKATPEFSAPADERKSKPTPEDVQKTIAFVDGALGAAGHQVTDPETRELLRRQAAGEITGDEARALLRKQHGMD
jgi:hypothetical protein